MNQHQRKFAVEKIQDLQRASKNKVRKARAKAREASRRIINADRLCRDAIRKMTKLKLIELILPSFKASHKVNSNWNPTRHQFAVRFGDGIEWSDRGYREKFHEVADDHNNQALVILADNVRHDFEQMIAKKEKTDAKVDAKYEPMLTMIDEQGDAAATQVMLHDGPEALKAIESFTRVIDKLDI